MSTPAYLRVPPRPLVRPGFLALLAGGLDLPVPASPAPDVLPVVPPVLERGPRR